MSSHTMIQRGSLPEEESAANPGCPCGKACKTSEPCTVTLANGSCQNQKMRIQKGWAAAKEGSKESTFENPESVSEHSTAQCSVVGTCWIDWISCRHPQPRSSQLGLPSVIPICRHAAPQPFSHHHHHYRHHHHRNPRSSNPISLGSRQSSRPTSLFFSGSDPTRCRVSAPSSGPKKPSWLVQPHLKYLIHASLFTVSPCCFRTLSLEQLITAIPPRTLRHHSGFSAPSSYCPRRPCPCPSSRIRSKIAS